MRKLIKNNHVLKLIFETFFSIHEFFFQMNSKHCVFNMIFLKTISQEALDQDCVILSLCPDRSCTTRSMNRLFNDFFERITEKIDFCREYTL